MPTPPPSRYPSAACDRSVTRYSRWCTSSTRSCTSLNYPPPWIPTPGDGSWRSSNGLCLPRTVTASIWRLRSKRSAIYFYLLQSSLNLAIPLDLNGFRGGFFSKSDYSFSRNYWSWLSLIFHENVWVHEIKSHRTCKNLAKHLNLTQQIRMIQPWLKSYIIGAWLINNWDFDFTVNVWIKGDNWHESGSGGE